MKHDLVVGLKNVKFEKDKLCSACQVGKQIANAHPTKSVMSTERPLELLHIDLFGPTTYRSIGGNCYCLVVVDDYSRYTCVFFFMTRPIHMTHSRNSSQGPKMNLSSRWRKWEVTMEVSLGILELRNGVMRKESSNQVHSGTKWSCWEEK